MKRRARQLALSVSAYLGVLLRNAVYARQPTKIVLPADGTDSQVRESLALSISPQLQADATALAGRLGGTLSRLAEALAQADTAEPKRPLLIYPTS